MFAGMLGSARRLKRYGVQMKGAGGGGGGIDGSSGPGGSGSEGSVLRFDVIAYQFDVLSLVIGNRGSAGYMQPFSVLSSPIGNPGGGFRSGGRAGNGSTAGQSGTGGHGAGSTGAYLQGRPLGAAGGGAGGGGGSMNRGGDGAGNGSGNPASIPTDGTGQDGEDATDDGGSGGGAGGGVDSAHPGGQGGGKGRDNSGSAGGGRNGSSWADPSLTSAFTGTAADLSPYGKGGRGGNASTSYGYRIGDGEDGTNGVAIVTDYETGQSFTVTGSTGFVLP